MDSEEELITGLRDVAEHLVRFLINRSLYLAVSESCTGGLIADALTRVSGASSCFWGSFVCYTASAKIQMLGVGENTLNTYGAVSKETAQEMAVRTLEKSGADAAVSVVGLAGPDGDGSPFPVGTVRVAAALTGTAKTTVVKEFHFSGSRNNVRIQAAREALIQITELLEKKS
ncbi:MAG: CinA family protein [Treponema sp.]|nr:CinA family protein [Treponema sp.]